MGQRVLLTHHRKLDRWLQLGGHADGDRDLARVALKEAEEESGLAGLVGRAGASSTWIATGFPNTRACPATGITTCATWCAPASDEDFVVSDESHALAWREIAALVDDADADPSLRRMARKWLARSV